MNKKNQNTAELLRKWGYSVQENIYKDNQSQIQENKEKKKVLKSQFQSISNEEIIEELRKRVNNQVIKFHLYPNQEHIFITAKDPTKEVSFPLPLEIKEKDHE